MKYLVLVLAIVVVKAVEFHISNNLQKTIWVGVQGFGPNPHLEEGGFVLKQSGQRIVLAPGNWSGWIWARTQCNPASKLCATGSCGRKIQCSGAAPIPPVTLVEIGLKAREKANDYYGISLIDGFNVPAKIEPLSGKGECLASNCIFDLNSKCHEELSLMSNTGEVIGCNSACNRFFSPCCRNRFKAHQNCSEKNWAVESTTYFKTNCPEARDYLATEVNRDYLCSAQFYSISFGQNN